MEKDLESLGIYDLRNYARAMGVQSPTTLKRAELIAKINQIIEGVIPNNNSTKKGRPPKHSATDSYVIDLILQNHKIDEPVAGRDNLHNNINTYFKNTFFENNVDVLANNVIFKGFFENTNSEYGVVYFKGYQTQYAKENTFVLRPLIEKHNLKTGDYIEGVAKYIAQKNIMLATEINYVNDLPADKNNRTPFENLVPQYQTKKIKFDADNSLFGEIEKKYPIYEGARAVFDVEKSKIKIVSEVLKSLSQNNEIRTLLVSIDDSPEDIGSIIVNYPDVEVCQLKGLQNRENFFKQFKMYLNNCVNRFEFGQKVAIVFYNAQNFENALKENIIVSKDISENSAKVLAANEMKDVLNLARYCYDASLTIIAFDLDEDLAKFANNYIKIDLDDKDVFSLNEALSWVKQ